MPTIAMTIAKWADEKGILGGSFFTYNSYALGSLRDIFAMLASQLAQFDSQYKRTLYDVLQVNEEIPPANLQWQFDGLIRMPLSTCQQDRPILVVVECLFVLFSEVEGALRLLFQSDAVRSVRPKLRILITSSSPELDTHRNFV